MSVTGIQASRYQYLHITGELEGFLLWRQAGRNIQPVAQYGEYRDALNDDLAGRPVSV